MSVTLILIFGATIFGICTVVLFFRPAIALSVGILGSVFFGIIILGILHLGGGVSMAWLVFTMVGILMLWKKSRVSPWRVGDWGDWAALILGLIVMASVYYTPSPIYGGQKAKLFLGSCIPLYFLGRMCGQNLKNLNQMLNMGAYLSLGTTFLYLMLIFGAGSFHEGRFGGGMSNMYGIFLVNGIAYLIYWVYQGRPWQRVMGLITIAVAIGILPFTASRGAIIVLVFVSAITFVTKKRFIRSVAVLLLILILLGGGMLAFRPTVLIDRFQTMDGLLGTRSPLFNVAFDLIKSNPLAGIGVGGYSQFIGMDWRGSGDIRSYPHNLWLEIACEQGLIGLVPLLLLTAVAFKRVVRIRKSPDIAVSRCVQMLFWINFLQCSYTGDLPYSRGFFALSGVLAGLQLQWKAEDAYSREMAYWNALYPDGFPEAAPGYQYSGQAPVPA